MRDVQRRLIIHFQVAFVCMALLLAPGQVRASCGSSSCPLDLHALGRVDSSRFLADLSFQYIHQDVLRHRNARGYFGEVATEHDEVSTVNRLATLLLEYRIASNLQLAASLPFVSRSHTHIATDPVALERWNFGAFGDAAVRARYRVFVSDRAAHDSLWIFGGVKFPSGVRHERNAGEEAEVTLQPGSGSVDETIGASYQGGWLRDTGLTGLLGHVTIVPYFVSASYRRNGNGTYGYRRGSEVLMNVGSEYPIASHLDLLGQVNVRHSAQDSVGITGEDPGLTGGTFVYVSPGLRLNLASRLAAYAVVQLPVYESVNGLQLTSRANYVAGIQQRF